MKMKIKLADEVLVLQGKDKGKSGKIEKVLAKKGLIFVAGVNIYKRHIKKQANMSSGIVDLMKPIPAANVALICPKCKLPTKVGFVVKGKEKERICKKCKQQI